MWPFTILNQFYRLWRPQQGTWWWRVQQDCSTEQTLKCNSTAFQQCPAMTYCIWRSPQWHFYLAVSPVSHSMGDSVTCEPSQGVELRINLILRQEGSFLCWDSLRYKAEWTKARCEMKKDFFKTKKILKIRKVLRMDEWLEIFSTFLYSY